jgi:hypothetical protein
MQRCPILGHSDAQDFAVLHRAESDHPSCAQKKRAAGLLQGPLIMKVKNLQRGTADAVELGGKSHHVHQLSAIWWFFVQ